MIPKTLKVGDKFTDGKRQFEVIRIDDSGAVSKFIGITKENVKTEDKKKEITSEDVKQLDSFNKYTKTEINRLNNAELEKVCDQLGLEKSTGMVMKQRIIDKLGL